MKQNIKNILVSGGAGYIGSHVSICLIENNYNPIIVDNLSNSNISSIENIRSISNKNITFYKSDIRNSTELERIFEINNIDSVIHLAGSKAVEESIRLPIEYYDNNIVSTLRLLQTMKKYSVRNIIFSSSASVYGQPEGNPDTIDEQCMANPINPYGRTKRMIERILEDTYMSTENMNIVCLRYFNPVGSHESNLLGDNPSGIPNNLIPYIMQTAMGKLDELKIYGKDYNTKDGTAMRDYIHIEDLADGHIMSIKHISNKDRYFDTFNLGTGICHSVLDIVDTFNKISNIQLKYRFVERRSGDAEVLCANPYKANTILNWHANRSIHDMLSSAWSYAKKQYKL